MGQLKSPTGSYFSPYWYLLTMTDTATQFVEASPLTGITVQNVYTAFINTWVSRFGAPLHVVTKVVSSNLNCFQNCQRS